MTKALVTLSFLLLVLPEAAAAQEARTRPAEPAATRPFAGASLGPLPPALQKPYPVPDRETRFHEWYLESRRAVLRRLAAARAAGDADEAARMVALLGEFEMHVFLQVRRLRGAAGDGGPAR